MSAGTLAVVVVHPDDESLWFGGTLLLLRGLDLSCVVVCLTNRSNPVRAAEFAEACAEIGARPVMLDFPDGASQRLTGAAAAALERLTCDVAAPLRGVITHPPHGNERSHPQHVSCFKEISRLCADRGLPFGFFSEMLIPGLMPYNEAPLRDRVSVARLKRQWTTLLDPEITVIQRRPFEVRSYLRLVRRWTGARWHWRRASYVFRIAVELPLKHRLLAVYRSQRFDTYQAYWGADEFLYTDERLRKTLASSFARFHSS